MVPKNDASSSGPKEGVSSVQVQVSVLTEYDISSSLTLLQVVQFKVSLVKRIGTRCFY
jgi:hypothetical protein